MAARTTRRPQNSNLRPADDKGLDAEPESTRVEQDDDADDDDDGDEDGEEIKIPGDEDDEDEPADKDLSESAREIKRAQEIHKEAYRRGVRARDRAIAKMKGSGTGAISTAEADRIGKEAHDQVLSEAMIGRAPGWYVTSPFDALDENGARASYTNLVRLPDKVVARLREKGDLKLLKKIGCVRELKAFTFSTTD